MARVLVVEDSPEQARLIVGLLRSAGFDPQAVASGEEAIRAVADRAPDIVVTDLILPGLTGLDVVEQVHRRHPLVPVILMTAFGSEAIARRALMSGAASYVPKRHVHHELVPTIESTLAVAQAHREQERMLRRLERSVSCFALENDPTLVPPLAAHVQDWVRSRARPADENELMQIGIALHEALLNAMHHGNLEVGSELRERDGDAYRRLLEQRSTEPPYRDRRVHVRLELSSEEMVCVIRDEGPGFDPHHVPDPTDAENLERVSGRGLYLIWTFMDRVQHNDAGNEVTLVKRLRHTA